MEFTYTPYNNQEFEVLMDRIHPPRVCIDNDSNRDSTLVKVDSANKQGMLLEMVQVLTDLDLVISKSYISSDGGWLMDVFHVTDQQGNKITDESLMDCIKEGICASRQIRPNMPEGTWSKQLSTEKMALEMTGTDKPGLMSEMSAALTQLSCHVSGGIAWTHNGRAACIIFVEDTVKDGSPLDPCRVSEVQAQLENVIEAHHQSNEQRSVKFAAAALGRTHTERRLHQLMTADRDYEECCSCGGGNTDLKDLYAYEVCHKGQKKKCNATHVRIENCKENGYSIINITSRDRPKLLFDTVCALTDLQYVVHHAAIGSQGSTALQEYYVKPKDGSTGYSEVEKCRIVQCLIAATERRNSHGLKLEICTINRTGLLSDVTRIFRENGLSITRAEIGIRGEKAVGTFYVKETSGENVNPLTVEKVRQELGDLNIAVENKPSGTSPEDNLRTETTTAAAAGRNEVKDGPRFSLGNMLWAQLERLSYNFKPIKS